MERWDLQKIFAKLNPDFNETTVDIAPDGDVQLTEDQIRDFQVKLISILCINFIGLFSLKKFVHILFATFFRFQTVQAVEVY